NKTNNEEDTIMKNETILVTGATGQQGGTVVRHLLRQGEAVRALTRTPSKATDLKQLGVEVVEGNLSDRTSLDAALKGIKKVFLVTTFFEEGMDAEVRQGITMVDAAKAAGVEHLVFSSVGSAHRKTSIPHFETKWQIEQHIQKIGLPATILRPTAFMENFGTFWQPSPQGVLMVPLRPATKLQMIALQDIGKFAAAAFLRPAEFIGQAIDLAGDELTMPEAASLLSSPMGRSVEFQQLADDQAEAAVGSDFARMFRWFNEIGYDVDIPTLKQRWGIPLMTFKEAVDRASWAKPA
ncbi:MAG: NmrA/HSCARG family protein, partial [Nitrospiria bacterium]